MNKKNVLNGFVLGVGFFSLALSCFTIPELKKINNELLMENIKKDLLIEELSGYIRVYKETIFELKEVSK